MIFKKVSEQKSPPEKKKGKRRERKAVGKNLSGPKNGI